MVDRIGTIENIVQLPKEVKILSWELLDLAVRKLPSQLTLPHDRMTSHYGDLLRIRDYLMQSDIIWWYVKSSMQAMNSASD